MLLVHIKDCSRNAHSRADNHMAAGQVTVARRVYPFCIRFAARESVAAKWEIPSLWKYARMTVETGLKWQRFLHQFIIYRHGRRHLRSVAYTGNGNCRKKRRCAERAHDKRIQGKTKSGKTPRSASAVMRRRAASQHDCPGSVVTPADCPESCSGLHRDNSKYETLNNYASGP